MEPVSRLLGLALELEEDVVASRQRARQIAALLGFDAQDQTRLATALSEVARAALQGGKDGRIEFSVAAGPPAQLRMTVRATRRPVSSCSDSAASAPSSFAAARILVDRCDVASDEARTNVTLAKTLPAKAGPVTAASIAHVVEALSAHSTRTTTPLEEMRHQNDELIQALARLREQEAELREREAELLRVNQELDDTNRGVMALYAELDDRAQSLQRANDIKTRFLSNMSHEFRTPLSSMLSLTRMLLDRTDGELSSEQELQINYIRKAAEDLSELVNDLLDIAKVEAGKLVVRAESFGVEALLGALRGMFRPLVGDDARVALVFAADDGLPDMTSDEGKIAQILRNFIANALKFTHRGEVRVTAQRHGDGYLRFAVSDTGIGIAPADQARIFEEFEQVHEAQSVNTRGTGLGLPLTRRLAALLGGRVELDSVLGSGSTFSAIIPVDWPGLTATTVAAGAYVDGVERGDVGNDVNEVNAVNGVRRAAADEPTEPDDGRAIAAAGLRESAPQVLVVEDDEPTLYVVADAVRRAGYSPLVASDGQRGLELAAQLRPAAIVLDLAMPGIPGEEVMRRLAASPATAAIPIIINTSRSLAPAEADALQRIAAAVVDKSAPDKGVRRLRAELDALGLTPAAVAPVPSAARSTTSHV
jgi:signal transduction histidine kinase